MSSSSSVIERHPSLYHADGDIALAAKTAAGITQIFRVDRILLSRHSDIFRDMFMVASDQGNAGEIYDGIPLVVMPPDDTAEDLQSLLEVMYDPAILHEKLSSKLRANTPLTMAGLANIAHKYFVLNVANAISKKILSDWPETLEEWDERAPKLEQPLRTTLHAYPEPASAIEYCRTRGLLASLPPSAFYQLSITPCYTAFRGEYGSRELLALSARWFLLTAKEIMLSIAGRDELKDFVWNQIQELKLFVQMPSWNVEDQVERDCHCESALQALEHYYFSSWYAQRHLDILETLRQLSSSVYRGDLDEPLCEDCTERIPRDVHRLRLKIWQKLPKIFDVALLADP